MTIYFSPTTKGFYDTELFSQESMPKDVVHIDMDTYNTLLTNQGGDYEISTDMSGRPVLAKLAARVPSTVTKLQAKIALLQAGYLEDVEAYIGLSTTDPVVRIAWQDAQELKRMSTTVLHLQEVLGLTDVQLDDLFKFAATIHA